MRDALKGVQFTFEIQPYKVTASNVTIIKKSSNENTVNSVKVTINGKTKRVPKNMWAYSNGTIIFSGDYVGEIQN